MTNYMYSIDVKRSHSQYNVSAIDRICNIANKAMTPCSSVFPLLTCAVLLCSWSFSAATDSAFTAEVDGVNVTIDNGVCEVAAWRVRS